MGAVVARKFVCGGAGTKLLLAGSDDGKALKPAKGGTGAEPDMARFIPFGMRGIACMLPLKELRAGIQAMGVSACSGCTV